MSATLSTEESQEEHKLVQKTREMVDASRQFVENRFEDFLDHFDGFDFDSLVEDWQTHFVVDFDFPDDLKTFAALLCPLGRWSTWSDRIDQFTSTFLDGKGRGASSTLQEDQNSYEENNYGSVVYQTLNVAFSLSDSSGRGLPCLKGLKTNAIALSRIWARSVTASFRLSSFQWFRESVGARHEYLFFKLESDQTEIHGKELWLRVERRPPTTEECNRRRHRLTRMVGGER
ncbi:unnamed protein product [Rhizoctonia solani]|uniref:Uncharacterized protein n=1 Tax=Rhizoctonia solani TaxID=456999 RepID=A0A8H2W8A9_9AGAM|nr:unnamed protein product [Rhizoctonia solani]